jgi:hypothetical protein
LLSLLREVLFPFPHGPSRVSQPPGWGPFTTQNRRTPMSWVIFITGIVLGFCGSFFIKDKRYAKLKAEFHQERKELKEKIGDKAEEIKEKIEEKTKDKE